MAKAKRPVSVDGIEFDALMSEDRAYESNIPDYPVEKGFVVSDAIIKNAEQIAMTLYLSPTPVTWHSRHGSGESRVDAVISQLEELYFSAKPVTVVTSDATYTNMGILNMTIKKSSEIGYAREIPITFKKIRVTEAKTTHIPDSYGKSGKTGASAGNANTTAASTAEGSGGSGASGSGNNSPSKGEQNRGSGIVESTFAFGLAESAYNGAKSLLN